MDHRKVYSETTYLHPEYGKLRVVAVANASVGDWAAYQHYVSHTMLEVAENGDKISRSKAETLFPEFAKTYEWRD